MKSECLVIIHGLMLIWYNIERAVDLLLSSEKPIILAGGGTIISSAFAELQSIAEMLMIPVVTTFKGKGAFPENHPLSLRSNWNAWPC